MRLAYFFALALFTAQSVAAATLSDITVSDLRFDVQTESPTGAPNVSTYTGLSGLDGNTVGFTMNAFAPLTSTTDTLAFNFGSTVPSLGTQTFEHVHVGGYTITFDTAITSLLVFAQNDNNDGPGIDFGILPSDFGGSTVQTGTNFSINAPGEASYFLYEFAATTSLDFVATGPSGGWDTAFFANVVPMSPIPLPAAGWLLLAGAGSLFAIRRRKKP